MSEFRLPSLGADMDDATVVEWHVKPGDMIKHGQVIVSVETSKGIIDIECFDEGVVEDLCVPVGTKVAVGTVLAHYRGNASAAPAITVPSTSPATSAQPPVVPHEDSASRLRISPAARKRARELGVDPAVVRGTGEHSAITIADIENAAHSAPAVAESSPIMNSMRKTIAAAMVKSKREIPHYYLSTIIDMSAALEWLEQQNRSRSVTDRLVYSVLLVKAVARALEKSPELNGWWLVDTFKPSAHFHIGMAISLRQGGIVVPALQDVNAKPVGVLMPELLDLVNRARSGHMRGSDLAEASITITSLGEQGVESVLPVIYPPQVAIVGFGAILERPWSVNGAVVSRRVMTATLAADHRISDGVRGSRFLAALAQLLQTPDKL